MLPPELLYTILITSVADCIHAIGIRRATSWDVKVFTTLARVSPDFGDIICKVAENIYQLTDRLGQRSIIDEAEQLMHEFHQLCTPDTWSEIAGKHSKQYPSNVFNAYAPLNSAIDLRTSMAGCPIPAFFVFQEQTRVALKNARSWRIRTPEVASAFELRCQQEEALCTGGITLVGAFREVDLLLSALPPLPVAPSQWHLVTEDKGAAYAELGKLLFDIERMVTQYDHESSLLRELTPLKAVQLPGVADTIRKLFSCFDNICINTPIFGIMAHWKNSFLLGFDFVHPKPIPVVL